MKLRQRDCRINIEAKYKTKEKYVDEWPDTNFVISQLITLKKKEARKGEILNDIKTKTIIKKKVGVELSNNARKLEKDRKLVFTEKRIDCA